MNREEKIAKVAAVCAEIQHQILSLDNVSEHFTKEAEDIVDWMNRHPMKSQEKCDLVQALYGFTGLWQDFALIPSHDSVFWEDMADKLIPYFD